MDISKSNTVSNFSKENLSPILSLMDADILKEFVHRCADKICGRKGPSEVKFCSSCGWSPLKFLEANVLVENFLVECIVHDYDRKKVEECISLEDNQFQAFMNCLAVRKDELQICILNQYHNRQLQVLSDFDWKLKWVMGSSSLTSYQETILELDMTTIQHKKVPINLEPAKGIISVELTHEDVVTLISAIEKSQESV